MDEAFPPPNFSWVEAGKVAGLAWPSSPAHYRFLVNNGIRQLVCLCERTPPHHRSCAELTLHHISVVDFTPPTPPQIQSFLSICQQATAAGEAVGVHCMHGHGRTGTMLACYLVKTRGLSAEEAIQQIRSLRPGSIETAAQEQAVLEFQRFLGEQSTV